MKDKPIYSEAEMEIEQVDVYSNVPQMTVKLTDANETWCIWGRGTGKTTGPLADFSGTRTQVFEVGPNVTAGNKFYVMVYSHLVQVVAVNGDTPQTIATKLRDAVNATTTPQWNEWGSAPAAGTPGYPPTATSNNNQLTIVLNYGNQFACGALIN